MRSCRSWLYLLAIATLSTAVGCSGSSSPTAPTLITPADASSGGITGAAEGDQVQFSGTVASASAGSGRMQLLDGPTVIADGTTSWEPVGDLFSVAAVADALQGGASVTVEGTGVVQSDGAVLAERIKAQSDGNDQLPPPATPVEFAGNVQSVNEGAGTLSLADGTVVSVNNTTRWDVLGDLLSLAQVAAALDAGDTVTAEGSAAEQADGTLLAEEIKVESTGNDEDDPGDDEDPGGEPAEFEGAVRSVNRAAQSLSLAGGQTVLTDGATQWASGGDLRSFAALADAIATGRSVRAEGRGLTQADGAILATSIKAEVDDEDDEEGDDDGNDNLGELRMEIRPDEWRTEWADGGSSGGGDSEVEVRFEGSGFDQIVGSSVSMQGPGGSLAAGSTSLHSDSFRAGFSKRDAIGLLGGAQDGDRVTLTVRAQLTEGSQVVLTGTVKVRGND